MLRLLLTKFEAEERQKNNKSYELDDQGVMKNFGLSIEALGDLLVKLDRESISYQKKLEDSEQS